MFGALISIKNVAHFKLDKAKKEEVTNPLEGRAKYGIDHTYDQNLWQSHYENQFSQGMQPFFLVCNTQTSWILLSILEYITSKQVLKSILGRISSSFSHAHYFK